jgi:hypothetical protein
MQKSLFTEGALVRKTGLMRLQMVMHGALILLNNVTVRANIVSVRILYVSVGHGSDTTTGADGFNFSGRVQV